MRESRRLMRGSMSAGFSNRFVKYRAEWKRQTRRREPKTIPSSWILCGSKSLINSKSNDIKFSRMISSQTAPQLRIIQNNDQLLVEKILSSILNAIPLWKNQIVIAISLFR